MLGYFMELVICSISLESGTHSFHVLQTYAFIIASLLNTAVGTIISSSSSSSSFLLLFFHDKQEQTHFIPQLHRLPGVAITD